MRHVTDKTPALKFGRVLVVLGAVALLTACETARDPELLNDPNYSSGRADGCQTAHSRVAGFDDTITKDRELARREPAYEIGWRDGYNSCGGENSEADSASDREIFINESEHWESVPR